MLAGIINHRFTVWLILGLPSIPLLTDFVSEQRYYAEMMYDSGVLSVQLWVLSLAITPLSIWARTRPKWQPFARWWIKRRRYIGVACFAYAVIHLVVYLRDTGELATVLSQVKEWEYILGWLALVILLLLAVTSNNKSVKILGVKWKQLHRFSYLALIFVGVHWLMFGIFLKLLCTMVVCVVILQGSRLILSNAKSKPKPQPQAPKVDV